MGERSENRGLRISCALRTEGSGILRIMVERFAATNEVLVVSRLARVAARRADNGKLLCS